MESITIKQMLHPDTVKYVAGMLDELKQLKDERVNLVGDERADNVRKCCGLILRINVAMGKLKAD